MTIEVILLNRSVNYIHRDISIMMIIDNVHNLIHVLCWLTSFQSFESIKQYDSTVERNSFTVHNFCPCGNIWLSCIVSN